MQRGEPDRHHQEQGRDPEPELQDNHSQHQIAGLARPGAEIEPPRPKPKTECQARGRNREQAVIELHRDLVLEQVQHPGFDLAVAGRHQFAIHQRESVEDQAGVGAGNEAAGRSTNTAQSASVTSPNAPA